MMSQKIKNYLGMAGIIAILLGTVSAWRYVGAYARSTQPSSFRSFSVSAEGKATAIPDVAQFSFQVITEGGKNLAQLQENNVAKINAAIAFLKENNVEAKDIKTESFSVDPRYQSYSCPELGGACPPADIVGYTIRQSVSVKVRNFGNTGAILAGLVDKGANTVSGLSFTTDDPSAVQSEARAEAIAKAKEKAKSVARAGGFRVGRLLSIYEDQGYPAPYYGYGMGGDSRSFEAQKVAAPTIEPGSTDTKVVVTLTYEID